MERKAQELIPLQVFPAQVKEVDENNRTCTVRVNDNVDLYEVKLYAVTDKDLKGFCLLPAKDSQVLVARIANGNDLYVCMFSVVDKVVGTVGSDTSIEVTENEIKINAQKIEFNGGKNGELVNISSLVSAINTIEDDLNSLKEVFSSWVVCAQDGGLALFNGSKTWVSQTIEKTTINDLKDEKITH